MSTFNPIRGKVVLEQVVEGYKSPGGLVIPETVANERPKTGIVIAVGAGVIRKDGIEVPIGVKPGEKVIFQRYAGVEFEYEDKKYQILEEKDLFAVIEDDDNE